MDSLEESSLNERFGESFWKRFQDFRNIEFQSIPSYTPFISASQEFALLRDIELCYAAKAYYACLVLVYASVQIQIEYVKKIPKHKVKSFLSETSIQEDHDWLRKLRNDIMHGNINANVKYHSSEDGEVVLEAYCIRAFKLMFKLPLLNVNQ